MLRISTLFALTLALVACGDDDDDQAPGVDAGPMVDGDVPTTACTCMAVGGDYENGVGSAIGFTLPGLEVWQDVGIGLIGPDPVLRAIGKRFYVVNRFGTAVNVTPVDPADWQAETQLAPGATSNPQDIAIVGDKAYVVTLAEKTVKVFDLTDSAAPPALIELPVLEADADGNPDAASIVVVDGLAYVSLQHLEFIDPSLVPVADGQLVIIDTTTDEVVGSVTLPGKNPLNFLQAIGGTVYAGLVPDFSPTAGCLAAFVPGTKTEPTCLKTSEELGGFVSGVAPAEGGVYLAITESFTAGKVVKLAGGTISASITPATVQPTDLATCGTYLVVNDQKDNLGAIRVYDTASGTELTAGEPLDVGAPAVFANGIACFEK